MKRIFFQILMVLFYFNCGCATIFSGPNDDVTISSQEPNTEIFVNNVKLGNDQVNASFSKREQIVIRGSKANCEDIELEVERTFDYLTLLGAPFGLLGIIGIDGLATGAIQKSTQTRYDVTPQCLNR